MTIFLCGYDYIVKAFIEVLRASFIDDLTWMVNVKIGCGCWNRILS